MRNLLIALVAASCFPAALFAQPERKPPEIRKINVGFRSFEKEEQSVYKVGLWTPIYVELFGGTDGIEANADTGIPYLEIETVDSDDVGTRIRFPVSVKPLETLTFMGHVKTGRMGHGGREIAVKLRANGRDHPPPRGVEVDFTSLETDTYLFLTLGSKLTDLHRAVRKIGNPDKNEEKENFDPRFNSGFRHAAFETEVTRLPETWFGYNSIDLIVLSTENRKFLTLLGNNDHRDRLKALAQWVRRGGRLVVPIASQNQDVVAALLKSPAWDPPIPVVPPGDIKAVSLRSLPSVADWGGVQGEPFQRTDPKNPQKLLPIPVATLEDGKVSAGSWDVSAESAENPPRPLITRVRYGLGQITYMAFSWEDASFFQWPGKEKFLQTMVNNLAPRAPGNLNDRERAFQRRDDSTDLSTRLLRDLDNFDVTVIPFGYVALFIVLYILVVGPLDFILLKYVFKRLEWTWITFPVVVLAVSMLAYFAAYALKGRDLKINKIDIVDFDMRTSANGKNVHAYGHTFFTILSPRIQNYTIGLEPNPAFWGAEAKKVKLPNGREIDEVLSVDLLSWMGRPSGGPHDMGRSGSTGFFKNAYAFREDASGLERVPIPVWTTKAFSASWEQTLAKPPFVADLIYHRKEVAGKNLKITGKLENHLGVDLVDVWLIYDARCFPLSDGLQSVKNGTTPQPLAVHANSAEDFGPWVTKVRDDASEPRVWSSNPTSQVKTILFHDRVDSQHVVRNHLLRPLDLSWRVQEEQLDQPRTRRTREAILFARVRHVFGPAEEVTLDSKIPLATKLWLGDIPPSERPRPALVGQLNQDTYIRVILPVRPVDE